jgi:hypothetical protein
VNPYRAAFGIGFAVVHVASRLPRGKRAVCSLIGHDGSWWLGVGCGFDRPVCRRCKAVL